MPEYDDDTLDNDTTDESEGIRGVRKAQRAAEQRARDAEAALAEANAERREYAAVKAGLDPTNPQAAYFLKHYDGDPTADAIKEAAVAAGFISDGTAEAQQAEVAQAQMSRAFGGGETNALGTAHVGPPGTQVPAQEAQMWQEFDKALESGSMQAGAEVLRRYGRDVGGIEVETLSGAPSTTPLA